MAERFHARGHLHRVFIAIGQLALGQHRLIRQQLQRLLLRTRRERFQRSPRRGRAALQLLCLPRRLSLGQHRPPGSDTFGVRSDLLFQRGDLLFLFRRAHLNVWRHRRIAPAAVHRCLVEERIHAVVITLTDRVELMIMAAAAIKSQPHPHGAHRFCLIKNILHTVFCRDTAALTIDHMIAVKTGGQHLLLSCIRQQITGDLFHGKIVIRLISIEGANHPVTPWPHSTFTVPLIPIAIGIPCGLEPIPSHTLTITRRSQKPIDHCFKCLGRLVFLESIHLG